MKRLFEGSEYAKLAKEPGTDAEYWLPLIGLYTGARVNEICQLNLQVDMREKGGIWFFDFTEESASHKKVTKSGKTAGLQGRRRFILNWLNLASCHTWRGSKTQAQHFCFLAGFRRGGGRAPQLRSGSATSYLRGAFAMRRMVKRS